MQSLHGAPDSRIVSTSPGQPEKVSTADKLDVAFDSDGGVQKLVQTGNFEYHEPPAKPDTGGRAAFADKATYTPADQLLVLTGAPRVIDGGMTTTAELVRMNRQSGDAYADGDVKTTYSELKPQPNGALLATSDPIHVTAEHMASRQQPSIAHYTGNVRLVAGSQCGARAKDRLRSGQPDNGGVRRPASTGDELVRSGISRRQADADRGRRRQAYLH